VDSALSSASSNESAARAADTNSVRSVGDACAELPIMTEPRTSSITRRKRRRIDSNADDDSSRIATIGDSTLARHAGTYDAAIATNPTTIVEDSNGIHT